LPDLGSARPRSRASSARRASAEARNGIEIVHGVADLVDRQFLGLFQLAVGPKASSSKKQRMVLSEPRK
jgi:hypothetical protein